jgi:hypothetical protein
MQERFVFVARIATIRSSMPPEAAHVETSCIDCWGEAVDRLAH